MGRKKKYIQLRIDSIENKIGFLIAKGDFQGAEALYWVGKQGGAKFNIENIESEAVRITNWLLEDDIKNGLVEAINEFPYAKRFQ